MVDETARKAYDTVLNARKEAGIRHREFDSKRRKLKEDLESRERVAAGNFKAKTADQKLKEEIERLRKEGSRQVEEEQERVRQKILERQKDREESRSSGANHRIKIRWNASKDDPTNGGYTYDMLYRFLYKVTY